MFGIFPIILVEDIGWEKILALDFRSSKFCGHFDIEFEVTDTESKVLGNNLDILEVRIHKELIRRFYDRVK